LDQNVGMIIYKLTTNRMLRTFPEIFADDYNDWIFCYNGKAWCNETLYICYLDEEIPAACLSGRTLFVNDNFSAHVTPAIEAYIQKHQNLIAFPLLANSTPFSQPLDVIINKSLKSNIKNEMKEHLISTVNDSERYSISRTQLTRFIINAVKKIPDSMIEKSFRVCGLLPRSLHYEDIYWKKISSFNWNVNNRTIVPEPLSLYSLKKEIDNLFIPLRFMPEVEESTNESEITGIQTRFDNDKYIVSISNWIYFFKHHEYDAEPKELATSKGKTVKFYIPELNVTRQFKDTKEVVNGFPIYTQKTGSVRFVQSEVEYHSYHEYLTSQINLDGELSDDDELSNDDLPNNEEWWNHLPNLNLLNTSNDALRLIIDLESEENTLQDSDSDSEMSR